MATHPTAPPLRHALGLPAGSIRALLALGVLGYMWLLALGKDRNGDPILAMPQASLAFVYMQFLMVLILAHFFSAHGSSIGQQVSRRSPLGLPRGTMRVILLAGYLGLAVWSFQQRASFKLPDTAPVFLMLLVLVTAYMIGYITNGAMRFLSGGRLPAWFQDVQAWFALMGLLLLGVVLLVRLVINREVAPENQLTLENTEMILAGVVGLYFGARS